MRDLLVAWKEATEQNMQKHYMTSSMKMLNLMVGIQQILTKWHIA